MITKNILSHNNEVEYIHFTWTWFFPDTITDMDLADLYSPRCYTEQVELPVADLLISSTDQTSPPCSPSNSDFTPSTPSAWKFGEVEFELKEEEEKRSQDTLHDSAT